MKTPKSSQFFRWNSKVTASWVDISNKSYLGLLTLPRILRATQTNLSPISIDTLLEWIRIFFWKEKSRSLGSRTIGHMRFAKFWSKKILFFWWWAGSEGDDWCVLVWLIITILSLTCGFTPHITYHSAASIKYFSVNTNKLDCKESFQN